jgi:hypothetical protein
MNFDNKILTLVVIFSIISFFLFNKKSVENLTDDFMPESAADACRKISSRAEEIEAQYNGIAEIAKNVPFASLFNPNNYRAGDTSSNDTMRNIVNSVMTQEDITKISNECAPIATSVQRNVIDIDLSNCKYCETNPCVVTMTNVTQENIDIVTQTCMIQTAVDILLQNTKSIDAQALAQTLQKTQDLLSGKADSTKENCNVINTNMATSSYLETKAKCAFESMTDQENKIDAGCAAYIDIANVIQRNKAEKLQECIIGATVDKDLLAKEEAKVTAKAESEQTSKGLDPLVFAGSSSVSCVLFIVVGVVAYLYRGVAEKAITMQMQQSEY